MTAKIYRLRGANFRRAVAMAKHLSRQIDENAPAVDAICGAIFLAAQTAVTVRLSRDRFMRLAMSSYDEILEESR